MNKDELLKYLKDEEEHSFKGWDFSYLDERWKSDDLPWDYKSIIKKYLKDDDKLLDIGTGGGEILLSLNHPHSLTSVTEGYEPNIKLCEETLSPLGITVYPFVGDDLSSIDDKFDVVINRHDSYNEKDLNRILKPNGLFITQQVGAYNNIDLSRFFDPNHIIQFPEMTFNDSIKRLEENGFEIIYKEEFYPKLKFFDLGAIAFFARIISWEFIDFSVDRYIDKFIELNNILKEKGYIESTEHRFMIVAKKIK